MEGPVKEIQLTAAQQKRVGAFRAQIEPLRSQIAALEQGVHAMLSTVVEMSGAPDGLAYSLNEAGTVLTAEGGKLLPAETGKE